MAASPSLPTVADDLSFANFDRVLAVDPDASLLTALIDTWTASIPEVAGAGAAQSTIEADPNSIPAGPADGEAEARGNEVPSLTVLARKPVLDDAFDDFHGRSQGSGLQEAGCLSLSVLDGSQPNALVVADGTPIAVVDAGAEWIPIGDSSTVAASTATASPKASQQETSAGYGELLEAAEPYPLRTPSRRALAEAFAARCSTAVAHDLLELLDATPTVRRHDPCDQLVRAYLVGARHAVVNYDLRRASEDCGLASPSTLSTVKAELEADGLLDTEPVPQPRGRPRQRLGVGVDDLETATLASLPELVRERRTENGE